MAVATTGLAGAPGRRQPTQIISPWRQAFRRFRRHRLALLGLILMGLFVLLAVFAPVVASRDPNVIDLRARDQGPSQEHWFGTDRTGRDTFSRTLHAGRVSLAIGLVAATIAIVIGASLGSLAGYFGGTVDTLIMRCTDVVMTFPTIIIALTVVALTGSGIDKTILVIGLLNWPIPCRLVRAKFLSLRDQDFVIAAHALGAGAGRLIGVHLLPNVVDVLVVYASFAVVNAILLEAGLSFLGLGVQPPEASWGNMINVARNLQVFEQYPWQWAPAGLAIVVTVLATNFVGDGLRDALDPRSTIE